MAGQLAQIKTEDDEGSTLGDVPSGLNRDSSADDYIFAPFLCLFKTTLLNCKICHCYVKDEQTLDEHTRLEHNLLYHCLSESCKNLSFNNWNALYNHMKNHTDHMSDVSFKCTDCLHVASTMVDLEKHIGLYHQAGVFTCTHESCALPFWHRSALILHYNGKHPDCTDEQLNAIREMENVVAKYADVKQETEQPIELDPSGDTAAVTAATGATATAADADPVPVDATNSESTQNESINIESSGNIEKTFKDSYTSTDSTITGTFVSSSTQTQDISNDSSENIENPTQNSSSNTNTVSGTVTTTPTIEQQQPSDMDIALNIPDNNSQEMFDDPNTSNMLSTASTSASTSEELCRQTRNFPNPDNSTEQQQQCSMDSELNISIDSSSNIENPTRDSSNSTDTITGTAATINSELQPSDMDSELNISIDSRSSNIEVTTNDSSADNISGTATRTVEQQQNVIDNELHFPDNDSQEITGENLLNMSSIPSTSTSTSDVARRPNRRSRKAVKSHSIRKQSSKRVKRLPSCHGISSFRSKNSRYVPEKIYNNRLARNLNSTTPFFIASSANTEKPTSGGPLRSNNIFPTVPPDNPNPIRKQPNSRNSKRSQSDQGRLSSKSKRRRVVQEVDEEEEDEAHDDEHEPNLNMRPIRSANIMIHFVECTEKDCNGNDCNWAFPTYNQLRNHMKEKHGLDPFKCYARGCTKSFKTKSEFGGHSASHKNTKYLCPECADEFASQTNLTTHYQRVHQKGFYQCASVSGCTFKASLRCLIEAHHRTAHPPDNLECNLGACIGKRFSDSGSLRRHKRTHTGIKQYECKVCTKMFFRRDTTIRHIKRKHRSNGRNTKTRGQFVRKLSKNECMLRA